MIANFFVAGFIAILAICMLVLATLYTVLVFRS